MYNIQICAAVIPVIMPTNAVEIQAFKFMLSRKPVDLDFFNFCVKTLLLFMYEFFWFIFIEVSKFSSLDSLFIVFSIVLLYSLTFWILYTSKIFLAFFYWVFYLLFT